MSYHADVFNNKFIADTDRPLPSCSINTDNIVCGADNLWQLLCLHICCVPGWPAQVIANHTKFAVIALTKTWVIARFSLKKPVISSSTKQIFSANPRYQGGISKLGVSSQI